MSEASIVEDLVRDRYAGTVPGPLTDPTGDAEVVLPLLLRHRSVRRYSDQDVGDDVLRTLLAAAQSASSSSHNQCWSAIVVRDADRKRRFVDAGRVSTFAANAPVIVVFAVDWTRASELAARHGEPNEAVGYLESTLVGFVDAGIAAQNTVIAAESLGLGTCYLGSLRNEPGVIAADLGLPQGSVAAFGVALGYPAHTGTRTPKPRLPQHAVVHSEHYRSADPADVDRFGAALDDFYAAEGRAGTSWIRGAIARVRNVVGLHGRDRMRAELTERGLPSL